MKERAESVVWNLLLRIITWWMNGYVNDDEDSAFGLFPLKMSIIVIISRNISIRRLCFIWIGYMYMYNLQREMKSFFYSFLFPLRSSYDNSYDYDHRMEGWISSTEFKSCRLDIQNGQPVLKPKTVYACIYVCTTF